MYIPSSFQESDIAKLQSFMEQYSFATVVSAGESGIDASHLPLLLDRTAGVRGTLIGHMARANHHWRRAEAEHVSVIFHGPHAYVSPRWYEDDDVVPTWNYVAVHAHGVLRLMTDREQLRELVQRTVDQYEASLPQPWLMQSASPEFLEKLLDGIVGFEIEIERLEGKWKLSQNHPLERRQKVIRNLSATLQSGSLAVARLMQELDD